MGGGGSGSVVGGRLVVSGIELRQLSTTVDAVVPPVDGAMGRAASTMRGLDRRGWNAAQADGLWSAVSSEWVCLRGGLIPTARDLFRRSVLALILNRVQGTDLGPPMYGPYLPGQGPYPPLPFCVDLGYAPWLTPAERALLATQGLGALDQIPFRSWGVDRPPPPPPPEEEEDDKEWWETGLDVVQGGLDVVGLVPGFGEPADGVNALIYTARGDYVNAGLSAGGMIPIAGWGSTGIKWGRRGLEYADEAAAGARNAARQADEVTTATKLLDDSGRFGDSALESQYQRYLARKQAAGEPPRTREGWKERLDYFQNSGVQRGNNFNDFRRSEYPYNEVHLANGKRLDSYVPGEEIVSRKATDFDNVKESTFRDYVREIGNKYDEGTVVRSNKYPDLDGQPLEGRRILEVPDSNLSAARRAEFERIAREEGVEIRYVPESP
jgi:hypothetical protein